jgi:hypothetical protein
VTNRWTRTHDALGIDTALDAVQGGDRWAIIWCEGGVSRWDDSPVDVDGLDYVRKHVIEPAKRERMLAKAIRTGRTKTVIMAERWEEAGAGPLVLFYESGPYLLPKREDPLNL